MATKKCPNGHQYDSSIYGDNCPFCPESSHTRVNPGYGSTQATVAPPAMPTAGINNNPYNQMQETAATRPMQDFNNQPIAGGHTVIRTLEGPGNPNVEGGRKVVGILITYSTNPAGDVYKIYEGRNMIGRNNTNDIVISTDEKVSGTHLLIFFNEAEGVFWANDQFSSNGTYINGKFSRGETQIQTNDVIVIGKTKFVFLGVPEF